jgi:DNA-directed RNA polymerase subunit RPC12/RpoP
MTRLPRKENRLANLRCNNCGQHFVRPVPHVAIESNEATDPIDWVPESTSGVKCPWCRSKLVGLQDD